MDGTVPSIASPAEHHAMRLTPYRAPTGEDYPTADDLLALADLVEVDVRVPIWRRRLRLRALSLESQTRILREAGTGEQHDKVKFMCATLREGILVPQFTREQAKKLAEKNPDALSILCDWIWELSELTYDDLAARAAALAGDELGDLAPTSA